MAEFNQHSDLENVMVQQAKTDKKTDRIDTKGEALQSIRNARAIAIKDVTADVTKAYGLTLSTDGKTFDGGDEDLAQKATDELKFVKSVLTRLELQHLEIVNSDKETVDLEGKVTRYFEELVTIIGEEPNPDSPQDLQTSNPYEFWGKKDKEVQKGWYEAVADIASNVTSTKDKIIQKDTEETISPTLREFQDKDEPKKLNKDEKENFVKWIEANRDALRIAILRPVSEGRYVIDTTDFPEDLQGFINNQIGLSDLFGDLTNVVTTWDKDGKRETGILREKETRKNSPLKGGYFAKGGTKYMSIAPGTIVSTNMKDFTYIGGYNQIKPAEWKEPTTKPYKNTGNIDLNIKYKESIQTTLKERNDVATRQENLETAKNSKKIEITDPLDSSRKIVFSMYEDYKTIDQKQRIGYVTTKEENPDSDNQFPNITIFIPLYTTDTFIVSQIDQDGNHEYYEYEGDKSYDFKKKVQELIKQQEENPHRLDDPTKNEPLTVALSTSPTSTENLINTILSTDSRKTFIIFDKISNQKIEINKEEKTVKILDSEISGSCALRAAVRLRDTALNALGITETEKAPLVFAGCKIDVKKKDIDGFMSDITTDSITFENCQIYPDILREILKSPKFKVLGLPYSQFDKRPVGLIQKNKKLTSLDLSHNLVIDDSVITNLAQNIEGKSVTFPNLKSLSLADTGITDKSLEYLNSSLPNIQTLDLSSTEITDEGLKHLSAKKMPKLREISVIKCQNITIEGIIYLLSQPRPLAIHVSESLLPKEKADEITPADGKSRILYTALGEKKEKEQGSNFKVLPTEEKYPAHLTEEEQAEEFWKDLSQLNVLVGSGEIKTMEFTVKEKGGKQDIYLSYTDNAGAHQLRIADSELVSGEKNYEMTIRTAFSEYNLLAHFKLKNGKIYIRGNANRDNSATTYTIFDKTLYLSRKQFAKKELQFPTKEQVQSVLSASDKTVTSPQEIGKGLIYNLLPLTYGFYSKYLAKFAKNNPEKVKAYGRTLLETIKTQFRENYKNIEPAEIITKIDEMLTSSENIDFTATTHYEKGQDDNYTEEKFDKPEYQDWSPFRKFCFRREREMPGFTEWIRGELESYKSELNAQIPETPKPQFNKINWPNKIDGKISFDVTLPTYTADPKIKVLIDITSGETQTWSWTTEEQYVEIGQQNLEQGNKPFKTLLTDDGKIKLRISQTINGKQSEWVDYEALADKNLMKQLEIEKEAQNRKKQKEANEKPDESNDPNPKEITFAKVEKALLETSHPRFSIANSAVFPVVKKTKTVQKTVMAPKNKQMNLKDDPNESGTFDVFFIIDEKNKTPVRALAIEKNDPKMINVFEIDAYNTEKADPLSRIEKNSDPFIFNKETHGTIEVQIYSLLDSLVPAENPAQ